MSRWSSGLRLQTLGYPADLPLATRIKVGASVAEAYRQHYGYSPPKVAIGRGRLVRRVLAYTDADLPLIDAVIRDMLGDPQTISTEEEA